MVIFEKSLLCRGDNSLFGRNGNVFLVFLYPQCSAISDFECGSKQNARFRLIDRCISRQFFGLTDDFSQVTSAAFRVLHMVEQVSNHRVSPH